MNEQFYTDKINFVENDYEELAAKHDKLELDYEAKVQEVELMKEKIEAAQK